MTRNASPAPVAGSDGLRGAAPVTVVDLYAFNLERAPQAVACRWRGSDGVVAQWTWAELAERARRYAAGLQREGLGAGERIAIHLPNGPEWLAIDWAALSLGLVVVGLFADESAAGAAEQLADCGARVVFARDAAQWQAIAAHGTLPALRTAVVVEAAPNVRERRMRTLAAWLPSAQALPVPRAEPDALATIVYTSGATGRPKGVMLSHAAIVANARAVNDALPAGPHDVVLAAMPAAHLYARTVGFYAAMAGGATLAIGRGAGAPDDDLAALRPTILVGVPRVYERMHAALLAHLDAGSLPRRALFRLAVQTGWAAQQRAPRRFRPRFLPTSLTRRAGESLRARLGGRVRLAISGGAALSPQIARVFTALGVPLLQGYGLTEAGPVVSCNRPEDHDPAGVGRLLDGVEMRIEGNGELLVRSPSTMMGYWNDPESTQAVLDSAGWLRTGDKASRLETRRLYLTGRIKDVLVTASGEKASASDIEARLREIPLVGQAMVVGEAKPYLGALIVPHAGPLALLRSEIGLVDGDDSGEARERLEAAVLGRCREVLREAPHHHAVHRVSLVYQPWSVQNGLLTSTGKLRRCEILRAHEAHIERLYAGHYVAPATDCSGNATV